MKDSEFIELLNLYLDHEISAADAVRLEAEVQSNPARRRIYQDYCRMQKACKVLAHDFQTEPASVADKKVVPFSTGVAAQRVSRGSGFYTVGAFAAAAACLAIIFVGRSRQQDAAQAPSSQIAVAPVAAPQAVATAVKTSPATVDAPRAVRAANSLRRAEAVPATFVSGNALFLGTNSSADAARANVAEPAGDQFTWLRTDLNLVSLDQRLQLEQARFPVPAMTLQPEGQALGNGKATGKKAQDTATDMVTFQFTLGR